MPGPRVMLEKDIERAVCDYYVNEVEKLTLGLA